MYETITTISIRQAKQTEREDPQSSDPCGQYARHKKNKQDLLCANIVVISAVQPLSEPPTPHVVAQEMSAHGAANICHVNICHEPPRLRDLPTAFS